MQLPSWPYLTKDIPPLAGRIKLLPDDFEVEELPQYPCCGDGTHVYFCVEKTGITTLDLLRKLGRALDRKERDFGYAGLKDSRAVTRQMISLEHIEPERLKTLSLPGVKVLWTDRHTNKIKLGHLSGNKFKIKVRQIDLSAKELAERCLDVLARRGVPNYFGSQRFGMRGDSWILGKSIVRQDAKEFIDQLCGRPISSDHDMVLRARRAYDRGEYELAAEIWPRFFRDPRRACRILAGNHSAHFRAVAAVDRKLKRLFVSAYQSYLFNEVLASRVSELDRLITGDLACKHVNGAVFRVEDAEVEQPRADRFEISPSGPLFGYRMTIPTGEPGKIESAVLEAESLIPEDFRKATGHKVKGSRRPFRVQMNNLQISDGSDSHGRFLLLSFDLPSGAYATAILRELMKEHLLPQSNPGESIEDS